MKFQIRKVVLWPSRVAAPPRTVDFEPGVVNVISGASKTGKSAIIPIIDYCLGADRCAIPVETIRDACSWFGVLVDTNEGQKLFARRGPGTQKTTNEMRVDEGAVVSIPNAVPEKNTTAEAVKAKLDDLAGLSRLDFGADDTRGSGFKGRPSFRDLMAFTFQPQNIVANPDVLFFKADTYEHREKLKTIFPYVLNAISPDVLAAQHELEMVRRELSRKQRELDNIQSVSARWTAELQGWAVRARELGLAPHSAPTLFSNDRESLIAILREAVAMRTATAVPDPVAINDAMRELVELEREEQRVDGQLRSLRRRLGEMSKLKENADGVQRAIATQRDRLSVAKWLKSLQESDHICPVCDQVVDSNHAKLDDFLEALARLELDSARIGSATSSFDRELLNVKRDVQLCTEALKAIGIRKSEVEARSDEAQALSFRTSEVARFVGRVEKGLELHDSLGINSELVAEIEELKEREASLAKKVSRANVKQRLERALEKVGLLAGRLIPSLDAERPDDPISLSVTDLTVKVKGEQREDYLWEIGSGANWLSYHVAMSLALQQFFLESNDAVPSFLVYDQPSQVYFPRRLAKSESDDLDPALDDEDVQAVRKVFSVLGQVTSEARGKFQVIVLDHAGSDVWNGISGIRLVEEWREGKKLVPENWLTP